VTLERPPTPSERRCPGCRRPIDPPVLRFGDIPQATVFPRPEDPPSVDPGWPLDVHLCGACGLVHLDPAAPDEPDPPELTGLSGWSSTLTEHARQRAIDLIRWFDLRPASTVVERSSHGNHAPAAFTDRGFSVVEAATGPAAESLRSRGLRVIESIDILPESSVDLVLDDYALAHERDPVAVLRGLATRLAPGGIVCIEFDELGSVVRGTQYDAFRHGHHLYLSAASLAELAGRAGLRLISFVETPVHGGAAMAMLARDDDVRRIDPSGPEAVARAVDAGLAERATYADMARRMAGLRNDLLDHLQTARSDGRRVIGYGAPSRAVTLVNHVGITPDLVEYTVDRSPAKHGRSIPGARIPINPVERLDQDRPAELLVLAWPLIDEIKARLPWPDNGRTRLLRPLPRVELLDAGDQ
jgi:hypothetical protein